MQAIESRASRAPFRRPARRAGLIRAAALGLTLLGAQSAFALGLGEAVVRSDMSSPLRVTIPVVGLAGSGIDPESLRVTVPGESEHERLGYRDYIRPRDLEVRLSGIDTPRPTVSLTTTRVTREPALRFVVRASWPGGQAVREYALIIDPPPVARPTRRIETVVRPAAARSAPARGAGLAAPAPTAPPRAGTRYGPVAQGDTLSAIVRAAYPDQRGDLGPVLQAIVDRNPGAFIDGDPARVLLGAYLDLPAASALAAASTPTAPAPVASGKPSEGPSEGQYTVVAGDTLYAIARRVVATDGNLASTVRNLFEANPQAFIGGDINRLRIGAQLRVPGATEATTPQNTAAAPAAPSPAASAATAEQAESLRGELAETEAEIAAERDRQAELRARLDALLVQVESLRARDAALTEQTAALTREIEQRTATAVASPAAGTASASAAAAVDTPATPAAVPDSATESAAATQAATETAGAAPAAASSSAPAASAQPQAQARPTRRVPPPPSQASGGGLMDDFMPLLAGPVGWAIGGVLILAIVFVLLRLRRRGGPLAPRERADEVATARKLAGLRESHGESGQFEAEEIAPTPGTEEARRPTVHLTDAARAGNLAKEAAVHLAYEDYTAAKACIMEAIRLDPHRDEHKMVLVTVYESTGEQDKARELIDELLTRREQLPGELRERVEQLRQGTGD